MTLVALLLLICITAFGGISSSAHLRRLDDAVDPNVVWRDVRIGGSNVNKSCTRYITFIFSEWGGLGDQLENLMIGVTAALRTRSVLILPNSFMSESIHTGGPNIKKPDATKWFQNRNRRHHMKNYEYSTYQILGVPLLPKLGSLSELLRDTSGHVRLHVDEVLYNPNVLDRYPCGKVFVADDNSCGVNGTLKCAWTHSEKIHDIARPLLLEGRAHAPDQCITGHTDQEKNYKDNPTRKELINIVWHIRTGDMCLKCDDTDYFLRIWKFIEPALGGHNFQNIFSFQHSDNKAAHRIANVIPSSRVYTTTVIEDSICLFFNADILVSTGSGFPNALSQWFELHKPILIAERNKDYGDQHQHMRSTHLISSQRGILLNDGNVSMYTSDDLKHFLDIMGVTKRVKTYTLSPTTLPSPNPTPRPTFSPKPTLRPSFSPTVYSSPTYRPSNPTNAPIALTVKKIVNGQQMPKSQSARLPVQTPPIAPTVKKIVNGQQMPKSQSARLPVQTPQTKPAPALFDLAKSLLGEKFGGQSKTKPRQRGTDRTTVSTL